MAFLSCSASALSWSSSFILAECVDRWRRLRQEHPPVRAYVVVFAAAAAAERERDALCSAVPTDVRPPAPSPPPTHRRVPTDRLTDRPAQPAAGGLLALFLLIHVVAGAVVTVAVAVPLNLPHLLLLVLVVVVVVVGGGGDTPLMARSLAANECQVTRVAPSAAAATAAGAA